VLAYENPHNHLDAGMNVLFGDFHVEWLPEPDAARIRAEHPLTTSPASQP
jgi:prepilin-type processing-associated H-X9-DG protein